MELAILDPRHRKRVDSFVKSILRRGTLKWKPRNDALKAARIAHGKYICAECKQITRRKDIQLDHKLPVIDIKTGQEDKYRLYSPNENWQVLCLSCHDTKTRLENEMRQHYKNKEKE